MPTFVDLHVLPRVDDEDSCRGMAEMLKAAGYSAIGLTVPAGLMRDKVKYLRGLFEDQSIQTNLRVDLACRSRVELLRLLRRVRSSFDIVAVKCLNPAVASVACRDRRVDVVFFDPTQRNMRFTHSYANFLRGALEFNLISSLLAPTSHEIYSRLSKEADVARIHKTRVVLSGGCTSPDKVRGAMQLSAIGKALGLSKEQSLRGVSDNPEAIIHRNIQRRSTAYVEEGVTVVVPKAR